MLAEFCPAMYDLPTQGTIKKSKFPASSDQLFCKSMSMHSLSAKPAIVTAALNRSFPVYLLSTCLSSKERDLAILLQNGCFQCKRGGGKITVLSFYNVCPFSQQGCVLSARRQKVWPQQAEFEKRTSFSLCSQSQLQANVFSVEALLLSGHSVSLFCGLREKISGQ